MKNGSLGQCAAIPTIYVKAEELYWILTSVTIHDTSTQTTNLSRRFVQVSSYKVFKRNFNLCQTCSHYLITPMYIYITT